MRSILPLRVLDPTKKLRSPCKLSRRIRVGIAAVIFNVMPTVYRGCDSAVAFLFHRAQKIARVRSAVESRFSHSRRIEAAFGSETAFLRRVVKCADDEILTGMTLRTPGEFFIFVSEPLYHFRPRNVRTQLRADRS